ncbi:hypothetical protein SK128_003652, partial [Halocaridina rubra]
KCHNQKLHHLPHYLLNHLNQKRDHLNHKSHQKRRLLVLFLHQPLHQFLLLLQPLQTSKPPKHPKLPLNL